MNTVKPNISWKNHLRITWAITRKDILEAIRNKNILGLLASTLFIILLYRALPLLENDKERSYLLVFDAGESALVAALENSPAVQMYTYPTEDSMKEYLTGGEVPELGLVIPAGFDQALQAGQPLPLQGYVVNWISEAQARELQRHVEDEIASLLRQPVTIQMEGNIVYLGPEADGYGVSVGMALTMVVVMVGLTLIPHLMIEEKKNHTMETLLISPASPVHVVAAKALTGLFYCVLGAVIGLAANSFMVLHWWLALLAVVCGSLFAVTLGLLLGIVVEDRSQLSLWTWVFILPLIISLILSLVEEMVTGAALRVMRAIPSTVMFNLLRSSLAYSFDWREVLLGCAWLLACAGIGLGVITWLVRRQSRQTEGSLLTLRSTMANSVPMATMRPANQVVAAKMQLPVSVSKAAPAGLYRATASKTSNVQNKPRQNSGLQIIAALTAKDIRDAIRNKMLVSILLGVMFLVVSGLSLPLILGMAEKPAMVVYDPGRSTRLRELAASSDFRQLIVDSPEGMQERIGASTEVALGLVWPQNFDQLAGSGGTIEMDGYVVHWAKAVEVTEVVSFFEEQLSQESGSKVLIRLASKRAYPSAQPYRQQNHMVTSTLATALLTIGFLLSPLLIIEEKESRTFEALLISPASFTQVIAGKMLAGAVYCLIAALGVLLFTHYLIVQWPILLLTILLGTAFAVGLGILMGLLFDSQATLGIWGGLVLMVLLVAGMMRYFDTSQWPIVVQTLINFIPTTAIMRLAGIALSDQLPLDILWQNSLSLVASSSMVYILVTWAMRRSKR